jgi:hypothetical protein
MNRPKQRGTAWETAIVNFLIENGVRHAERRTLSGSQDKGDIAGIPGVVIEAKNAARMDVSGWVDEANLERDNAKAEVGVVWAKKRGKTSPGAGYVIMDGNTLIKLLEAGGWIQSRVDWNQTEGPLPQQ